MSIKKTAAAVSQLLSLCWHRAIFPVRRRNQLHSLRFRRPPEANGLPAKTADHFAVSPLQHETAVSCWFLWGSVNCVSLRCSSFSIRSNRFEWSLSDNTCLATDIKMTAAAVSQLLSLCWHRAIFPVRRRNQLHSLRFRRPEAYGLPAETADHFAVSPLQHETAVSCWF